MSANSSSLSEICKYLCKFYCIIWNFKFIGYI
jgi:hypothetical protein